MNIITYPEKSTWADLLKRPTLQTESLRETVLEILNRIKFEGDKAVREYEEKFDKVRLDSLQVSEAEITEAGKKVSIELKAAITLAYKNIHTFHAAQVFQGKKITTLPKKQSKILFQKPSDSFHHLSPPVNIRIT